MAFMFNILDGAPFYCSEGDLTKVLCKRMIGWSLTHRSLYGSQKMYDTRLSTKDVSYHYVAYLRKFPKDPTDEKDKGEIVRMNLTKVHGESNKRYLALFKGKEEQQEYYAGVLSHTKNQQFWSYKTRGLGNIAKFDVYEMLTDYE